MKIAEPRLEDAGGLLCRRPRRASQGHAQHPTGVSPVGTASSSRRPQPSHSGPTGNGACPPGSPCPSMCEWPCYIAHGLADVLRLGGYRAHRTRAATMRPASRTHKVAMQPHMVLPMTLSKWCWSRVVMVMLPPGSWRPPLIVAVAHPPVSDAQHSRDVLLGARTAVWLDGQVQEAGLADGPGQHLYLSDLSRERRVERTPPIDHSKERQQPGWRYRQTGERPLPREGHGRGRSRLRRKRPGFFQPRPVRRA
jgi:hypothetical protein